MNGRARTVVTVAAALVTVSALVVAGVTATAPSDGVSQVAPGQAVGDNATVLDVEPRGENLDVKPGETVTATFEVTNSEQDEAVALDTSLVDPEGEFPDDWVEVSPENNEVAPNETVEVDVTVDVPDDAAAGRHSAVVGLTDDEVAVPATGTYPLNSFRFSVNVDREPSVEIEQRRTQVSSPAGETHEFEFEVTNNGDGAVDVDPSYHNERAEQRTSDSAPFSPFPSENVGFDAPDEIPPGETATVTVEADVPSEYSGIYLLPVDLGVEDPARTDDYWRTATIHLEVWQDDGPATVEFDVEDTERFEFEASADEIEGLDAPEIDVTLYGPDGEEVDAETETVTKKSGSVSFIDDGYEQTPEHSVVETVDEPQNGTWTAEIETSNVPGFDYEVRRFD